MSPVALEWEPRWPPLEPVFAVARGVVATGLARLLLAAPSRLAALRGVVSPGLLAVTGSELPWVDGIEYFGRDGASAWLLVPTGRRTLVPTSWLERRYRTALPRAGWPCVLLPPLGILPNADSRESVETETPAELEPARSPSPEDEARSRSPWLALAPAAIRPESPRLAMDRAAGDEGGLQRRTHLERLELSRAASSGSGGSVEEGAGCWSGPMLLPVGAAAGVDPHRLEAWCGRG
jgi:hypothetical protein